MRLALLAALLAFTAACSKPAEAPSAPAAATASDASTVPATPPAPAEPAKPYSPPPPPPKIEKPLEVGSQAAKDDMYCYGVLIAANSHDPNELSPVDFGKQAAAQLQAGMLFEAGAAKIVAEKAALYEQTADISDAWLEVAAKDLKAKKPKISVENCAKRADALPAPKQ